MTDVKIDFLFNMRFDFEHQQIINVGITPCGKRRIIYTTGGTIEGPKLKANVLPGGGDWILIRSDGTSVLDVRAAATADDGSIIYIYYRGYLVIQSNLLKRISQGDRVDPSEYYFRVAPVFETASRKYSWLNQIVTMGVGQLLPKGVAYEVFAIL